MSVTATGSARPTAPLMQRIRLIVAGAFIVGLFVQFYLAGRGAFGASSYDSHRTLGGALHFVPPIIFVLTLLARSTRNRVDIALAILLIALYELQLALADLDHPNVGAFHPVNGLLILTIAVVIFWRDLRAVSGSRKPRSSPR